MLVIQYAQVKKISVLIPAYNEKEIIRALYERLDKLSHDVKSYKFEFLFINDGSKDNTLEIIKDLAAKDSRITYISLSRNFGKEIAMIAGLDHVKSDAAIIMDADLQDPPELIPKMIGFWEEGYDDVYARRSSRAGESFIKQVTSKLFYKLLQSSTNIPIQVDTGDFRLLNKKCVDALKQFRESERYTKGMFSWIGYKKKEVLFDRDSRFAGKTKWNYLKLINHAIDGVTSFTTAPLRTASVFGFLISLIAFVYIFYLLIRPLFGVSTGSGYSSLMAVILFLGGVQLISLGVIGEYIGRIFNETKGRPLYFVDEYKQSGH
ncbi:MAG: polyisoprenyl-phosphate glycosyltransferase [Patescibacteria group bacterium]|jgi:glycosyltransferase involved in cell wall biosynthesis|nr:polyisoprenyl-phosphate glycosyltransferase [Patescibacteria group bacterium]